jgi:branched-chain amino acid transport system permease protein
MLYTLGQNLLGSVSVDWYMLALGLLFVVVVLVAPDGIVGALRRPVLVRPTRALRRRRPKAAASAPAGEALGATGVVKRFGVVPAVDGVDLSVQPGEIVCLVGPNGAGKTTLLNLLSGELIQDAGSIVVDGHDVTRAPVHVRSALGMARTFQVPSLFSDLTVVEHLTLARQQAGDPPDLPELYRRFEGPVTALRARELSLGDRRALEIAVALASAPKLVLLDEPAAGLGRDEAHDLARSLLTVRERLGCAMVVVEHDMELVRMLADRVIVLHRGAILVEGSWELVHADERVRGAYLGAA